MAQRREPWLKYHVRPPGGENRLGPWGALLWPSLLKAAYPGHGSIPWRPETKPAAGVAIAVAARGVGDRRLAASGLAELDAAGLVAVAADGLVVTAWRQHRPRRPGPASAEPEPEWRRLYVDEAPTFARLSLGARGLAACLLRVADDAGAFPVSPDFLPYALRWPTDRQLRRAGLIDAWLAELLAQGYLEEVAGAAERTLRIARYGRHVGLQPASNEYLAPIRAIRGGSQILVKQAESLVSHGTDLATADATAVDHEGGVNFAASIENPSVADVANSPGAKVARGWRDPGATLASDVGQVRAIIEVAVTRSDRMGSDPDQTPIAPPKTGGQVAFGLSSPDLERPARAASGRVRRRRIRAPEGGIYPPWFEAMWARYPGRGGNRGPKAEAYAVACDITRDLASPEILRDQVLDALDWQCRLAEWRRPDPPIPDFVRYLARARWQDDRPPDGSAAYVDQQPGAIPAWKRAEIERIDREKAALAEKRRAQEAAEKQRQEQRALEVARWQAEQLLEGWRRGERLGDPLPPSALQTRDTRRFWREFGKTAFSEIHASGVRKLEDLPLWLRQWRATLPPSPSSPPLEISAPPAEAAPTAAPAFPSATAARVGRLLERLGADDPALILRRGQR